MGRIVIVLAVVLLPSIALAQDSRLERLDTTDAGRDWEAVGRLDIKGAGFCTGALIAPDLVLTAAHCLFDTGSKQPVAPETIEFLAGWRNGRASAYRNVRRAVVHPDYRFEGDDASDRVRNDVALLELQHPIRNTTVIPFETAPDPAKGARVGVVSYASDRAEAPSLQEVCAVMAQQRGVLVMSCDVDHGSSGAPIFSFVDGRARIVSVVSAKALMRGTRVALGTVLDAPLKRLEMELRRSEEGGPGPDARRREIGAKFVRP